MIGIFPLTASLEKRLNAGRRARDAEAEATAARIVADVRRRGDAALRFWTKKLDGITLGTANLWVGRNDLRAAPTVISGEMERAIEHAAGNIRRVAERQKPREWTITIEPGVTIRQRVQPLDSVGCYIPGGRSSLVSTLLMTAIPARVAGVKNIWVACPRPNAAILAAAEKLGVSGVARIGGAQAIAAFAYGTKTVPRVDKIFGPGNRYVTAAKKIVSSDCAIDMLAGPTEVLILARRGNPKFIAADLVAQAEHDPDAIALMVTTSRGLARQVQSEVKRQLVGLPAGNPAPRSLGRHGGILIAKRWRDAVEFVNRYAPEHLSFPDGSATALREISSAGSFFLGDWSAQPAGDYATGTNHVLPTAGWARTRGGLSVADFVKCSTVQQLSREGLRRIAPTIRALAEAESLPAHARAASVRTEARE